MTNEMTNKMHVMVGASFVGAITILTLILTIIG